MNEELKRFANMDNYIDERVQQLKNAEETYKDYNTSAYFVERSLARTELEILGLKQLANEILNNNYSLESVANLINEISLLDMDIEAQRLMHKNNLVIGDEVLEQDMLNDNDDSVLDGIFFKKGE